MTNRDNGFLIRLVLGGAVLVFLFGSTDVDPKPKPDDPVPCVPCVPVEPYTGQYMQLHEASRSMDEQDRRYFSDGFKAGADMVRADSKGLIKTTQEAQDIVIGLLSFNYNGLGKPLTKYAGVSREVESILRETLGEDVAPMTASDRTKFADMLQEIGKATI